MNQTIDVSEAIIGLLSACGIIALAYFSVCAVWEYVAERFYSHDIPVAPQYKGRAGTSEDIRVAWQLAIMEDKRREMEQRGMVKLTDMALPGQTGDDKAREYSNSVSTDIRTTMAVQRAMGSSRLIIPDHVREN